MSDRPKPNRPDVIVTGSSGLIGSTFIASHAERYQIVGFDRDGNPQPPPPVECVCVDLTDASSIDLGVKRKRYAYGDDLASVVHLAAYYSFDGEKSPLYDEVTVKGTQRLLEAIQPLQVEQFIFSSTMLVHKPGEPGRPINEDSPLEPKWAYPQSKVETEQVIDRVRGRIPVVKLRIAGVYTDHCDSIPIAHQIQRILENRMTSHVYPGDLERGQAFIHLDDLVDAIRLCIDRRHELPENTVLLLGEPETYSYGSLQNELGRLIHDQPEWTTEVVPKTVAKTGAWVQGKIPGVEEPFIKPWMVDMADDHYELDISRARRLLGWEPKHRLIDTLPKMIQQLREDPVKWYKRHDLPLSSDAKELAAQSR